MRTVSMPHRPGRHNRLPTQKGITKMLDMLKTYYDYYRPGEEGATAVEYGIMVALIAVAIIVAVRALGLSLSGLFGDVGAEVDTARTT